LKHRPSSVPDVPIKPEDLCLIQYTGGTTGVPKGTLLTHQNIVANITQAKQWIDFKMEQHEIGLSAFPFFHLAGLMLGLMALSSAATQCLVPDPRDTKFICGLIRKYKPTMLANVPTLYQMLLAEPIFKNLDFSRCKVCISGAAPFSADSIQKLETVVGEGKVMEVYGMTETSPLLIMNPYQGKKKIGTVGIPLQGVSVKLVDLETGTKEVPVGQEGELIAQGPQIMAGYKDKPAETDYALREYNGEKWLYTGDVAIMDENGYFKIVDRIKDMVNVGGYKVFSREVEEVLYQHPNVAFCAIVGKPNPKHPGSELVKAVIQPKGDFVELDTDVLTKDMIEFCRKQMAPYKIPKIIEFVESMPLTNVGKVDKKALR
jgi:long-chain acyl-CoA synthetase